MAISRVAWLVTVVIALITAVALLLSGYQGYAGLGLAVVRGIVTEHGGTITASSSAGAEFIVVVCGDVMTMPGLPKVPSADKIDIDAQGRVVGLF